MLGEDCDVLSRQKDAVVIGTYESNAFILSLRRRDEFTTQTHSFGYHRVPQIGVYGSEYNLALPMALLSLPPTPRYLERLPQEILNSLDLGHLMGSLTSPPPPSPQHLLSQKMISTLHTHRNLSSDHQLVEIARELVKFVINSAMARLGLTNITPLEDNHYQHLQLPVHSEDREKRPSVVSMASVDSEGDSSSTIKQQTKSVSIQVEGTVIDEEEIDFEIEDFSAEGEDALRLGAKKIVNKALHLACKRWESMNRRSSIDYLVASTKRLKISSPSPPPTVPEENTRYEYGVATSMRPMTGWDTPSPIPIEASHGKKRSRSESHDTMMMRELELFRSTQMGQEGVGERVIAKPRRKGSGVKWASDQSIGELITDINHMSIQKTDSESADELYSSEEDFTILSGVTKPADSSTTTSPVPPPNSPTSLQVMKGGANRCPSPLLYNVLPTALQQIPHHTASHSNTDEENTTCTSPEFQQKLLTLQPSIAEADITLQSQEPVMLLPRHCAVPEMDYFIILHTHPPPGLCQKFLCENTNEVNLLFHCWLYPNVPCEPAVVCSQQLEMGIFQPRGVAPVHQDLQDAGIAFYHLQPRTVCIHSCHFSPENAQLQLLPDQHIHTFFSVARDGAKRIVTLHLIPGASAVEESLREGLGRCSNLRDLIEHLSLITPNSTEIIKNLILT